MQEYTSPGARSCFLGVTRQPLTRIFPKQVSQWHGERQPCFTRLLNPSSNLKGNRLARHLDIDFEQEFVAASAVVSSGLDRPIPGFLVDSSIQVTCVEEPGPLEDGETYSLQRPTYMITDVYKPLPSGVEICPPEWTDL